MDKQIWTRFVSSKNPPEFLELEVATIGSIGNIFGDFDSLHVNSLNGSGSSQHILLPSFLICETQNLGPTSKFQASDETLV